MSSLKMCYSKDLLDIQATNYEKYKNDDDADKHRIFASIRSSYRRCSEKEDVFKNFANPTEK